MAAKGTPRTSTSREQWATQIAALDAPPTLPQPRKEPITVARIVQAALQFVEANGFDDLTMRALATALEVTPGALYAHVRDKAALGDLMIGELCSRVILPIPDPAYWEEQASDICRQLRDQYLQYPGISLAVLAAEPHNLDTLRIYEGLLAVLVTAGISPQDAGWTLDAVFLYIGAYSIAALRRQDADATSEVAERFNMLPQRHFPTMVIHVAALTSGEGHERFDFTLRKLLGTLSPTSGGNDGQ